MPSSASSTKKFRGPNEWVGLPTSTMRLMLVQIHYLLRFNSAMGAEMVHHKRPEAIQLLLSRGVRKKTEDDFRELLEDAVRWDSDISVV
jgi:hypothetical protein